MRLFSPATQNELLAYAAGKLIVDPTPASPTKKVDYTGINIEVATDLTPAMVTKFFWVCSEEYKQGLRLFAEKGPILDFNELVAIGIKPSQFQSRTTVRTRSVTHDPESRLLAWDEWTRDDNGQYAKGNYAVTMITYQSLRKHFGLD
jgi:hypothetical protein